MIDVSGFRPCVAMILFRDRKVFWAKRIHQDGWQFPQGGVNEGETLKEAMYRELHEEVGLSPSLVRIAAVSRRWLKYKLPKRHIRIHSKPLCIGQKQKWFLLEFLGKQSDVSFKSTDKPEFDGWKWVDYWTPVKEVVDFKAFVYKQAMEEFAPCVLKTKAPKRGVGHLRQRQRSRIL
jgi:putative (di)nucleoside polyphosphate hydrolase